MAGREGAIRRASTEFLATFAALGAVTVYLQLQDETSWLRLKMAELGDRVGELRESLSAWRAAAKVNDLIDSVREES